MYHYHYLQFINVSFKKMCVEQLGLRSFLGKMAAIVFVLSVGQSLTDHCAVLVRIAASTVV